MTNREAVVKILSDYGTMSALETAAFAKRKLGYSISASEVSGTLRPLISKGFAASSNCGYGKTVYWLATPAWREV